MKRANPRKKICPYYKNDLTAEKFKIGDDAVYCAVRLLTVLCKKDVVAKILF